MCCYLDIITNVKYLTLVMFQLLKKILPEELADIRAPLLMSDPHDLTKTWGDIDSAVRRISERCEVYKDPTDRVFSEATEAEKLVEIKESFEEEALQFRLAVIRERLKQEKRDSWLRPSAYYYMGFAKH
ncbi:unnamed protein product [Litomosoides sigmodontis]|uniref:Uncharacterized protein n=1 Tax=Litomosoides sigmodontis TaxID=42156 RepID=A0A3P6TLD8_LITSI|nr:unnamed protein product [Litomosoides sigmodontis]